MRFSDKCEQIVAALLAVQGEIVPVVKDRKNDHLGNRYATVDAITDYLRPICTRHGLVIVQGGGEPVYAAGQMSALSVITRVLHTSGEWVEICVTVPVRDPKGTTPNAQAAGSSITYSRRYGLCTLFALTTDEDDDGAGGRQTKQRKESRQEAKTRRGETAQAIQSLATFPRTTQFKQYAGKPLSEVPTEVMEELFKRVSQNVDPKSQKIASELGEALETRRAFGEPNPSLAPVGREDGLPFD